MDWSSEQHPAGRAADFIAAAVFAAAVGFSAGALGMEAATRILSGGASFLLVYAGLRRVLPEARIYVVPAFALQPIRLRKEAASAPSEELLLDNAVDAGPGARVIRLFGPPQDLGPSARDARLHVAQDWSTGASPDASEALSDALARLRRSLR